MRIYVLALLLFFSFAPTTPVPAAPVTPSPEHRLRMFNTHTGEHLDVVYKRGDAFVPESLNELDHFLRDWRTGDVSPIAPELFDVLTDLLDAVGQPGAELHIISGYRSPKTNQMLRDTSTGVAKNSLHMKAQAIDIRIPGLKTAVYRDAALKLARGGVGFYPDSQFVHVDVGRVRRW